MKIKFPSIGFNLVCENKENYGTKGFTFLINVNIILKTETNALMSSPPSPTQYSESSTMRSSDNYENSSSTFTSYRNRSASEILTEIKQFETNGIHYLGNDNIVDLCTFTYQKDIKGEILIPKNNTNNISELVFAGVFEIDARNFFMTSDGKWNSNNPLRTRFDQVKPSCRLLPIQKDEFSLFENNYSTVLANIRAIETLGNPRKSRDYHSIIIDEPGQPSQIKLYHHLFSVRY